MILKPLTPPHTPAEQYGRLVSVSMHTPDLNVRDFLRHVQGKRERFYWRDGRDPITFAAVGIAAELTAWGENRYELIEKKAKSLFANAFVATADEPMARPRLFGGFAFRDDFVPDNTWSSFYPAHFVLPHYQLLANGSDVWLTINAHLPLDDSDTEQLADVVPALREALQAEYELLRNFAGTDPAAGKPHQYELRYPMMEEEWEKMITTATEQMAADPDKLSKVVLSRVCEMRTIDGRAADIDGALDYLDIHYAGCYRFLFEPRPGHAFYGATPELLVEVQEDQLATMGLAGSERRGDTAEEDNKFGQSLLESEKDLYEHDLVVQSIQRRLEPLTTQLDMPSKPQLYKLSNIQHLFTPVTGQLTEPNGVLPLTKQLHPTPALGGSPRPAAMRFIQENEPVPRGWYAAPVGWIDYKLDGTFGVAIRSAVAQDDRVWAYAGAGIVEKSIPEKEWVETALKFRPMLDALGISSAGKQANQPEE